MKCCLPAVHTLFIPQEIVGIFHTPGEARQVAGELVHSLVQLDAQLGRTSGRDWIFQPRKTLSNIRWEVILLLQPRKSLANTRWEVLSHLPRPAATPCPPPELSATMLSLCP